MEGGDRHPASEGRKGSPEIGKLSYNIDDVLSGKAIRENGKQPALVVSGKIRSCDRTPVWILETPFYYRSIGLPENASFTEGKHTVAIFLDMEKELHKTWRYNIV